MDIQEAREAFEKRQAILVGVSYAEFKQRTDDFEKALGRRYGKKSINENEWAVWIDAWQAAKAHVPEGFVLVEKKNTEDWYLDDFEGMYWDHDGIDGSLCELDIGQVQAVEHKEYLITESNTLYATKTWDDANDQVDYWQFFKTKEEAEKAAAYCKTKFNDEPIEAQEQSND